MTITLEKKKGIVSGVTEVASKAISAVIVDYRGLKANEMTLLRSNARKRGVYLKVVRNTLLRRAFKDTSFACLNDRLVGSLCIGLSIDAPSDAARLFKDFSKTFEKLKVKALSIGGIVYEASQLDMVASLPTRDEALMKLMYVMQAPIEKLVKTLAAPQIKLVRTMVAINDQKQAG